MAFKFNNPERVEYHFQEKKGSRGAESAEGKAEGSRLKILNFRF